MTYQTQVWRPLRAPWTPVETIGSRTLPAPQQDVAAYCWCWPDLCADWLATIKIDCIPMVSTGVRGPVMGAIPEFGTSIQKLTRFFGHPFSIFFIIFPKYLSFIIGLLSLFASTANKWTYPEKLTPGRFLPQCIFSPHSGSDSRGGLHPPASS